MFAQEISRRRFIALGSSALAMGLFGCGKGKETEEAEKTETDTPNTVEDSSATPTEEPTETQTLGGWKVNAEVPAVALSDDERAVFDQALEGFVGMNFTPVCVLATQVVAGTNRAFLCQGSPVVPDADPCWFVVVIYENLEGACKISSVNQIDISEPATADTTATDGLAGGWNVVDHSSDGATLIPDAAAAAFVAAGENQLGMNLYPLALLGTQLVSGTNYRLICSGAPVTPEASTQLYVVDVYQNLEGAAEYTSTLTFSLLAYV